MLLPRGGRALAISFETLCVAAGFASGWPGRAGREVCTPRRRWTASLHLTCPVEALTAALARRDFAAIAKLPFALDAEGEPDTSAVRLDLAYTASGALAAFQPVEFREHVPTPLSASVILEGAEAQALRETLRAIDQSA